MDTWSGVQLFVLLHRAGFNRLPQPQVDPTYWDASSVAKGYMQPALVSIPLPASREELNLKGAVCRCRPPPALSAESAQLRRPRLK